MPRDAGRKAAVLGLSAFLCLAGASTADAQWVGACDPESAEGQRASAAVRSFGQRVADADPASDAAPLDRALRELLEDPCLALAREATIDEIESVPAAQRWLHEGGLSWLHSLVRGGREILVPPEMPETLSRDTAPADHPLRPLLCPGGDEACGRATAGWRIRAVRAFERHVAEHRDESRIAERRRECLAGARQRGPAEAYHYWVACVGSTAPGRPALPVGHFRAPDHGWLVLRGRRGHYSFCDEVRAYDLATGAAYVVASCGGLALRPGGTVDQDRTDAGRGLRTRVGRVPLDNLREAAWMTLFAETVRARRASVARFEVPEGLSRRFRQDSHVGFGFGRSSWGHSGQTRIAWAWVEGGRTLASGELTWPDSADGGEDHADHLWRVAEAALEEGCAPAALPRDLPVGDTRSGVSSLDADPRRRRSLEDRLVERFRGLRGPRCPTADAPDRQ